MATALGDWTGHLLARAAARAEDAGRAALPGPPSRDYPLLRMLAARGPISQGKLAELLRIHPAALARTLDRLVEAGTVVRDRDPVDRRNYALILSPMGRQTAAAMAPAIDAAEVVLLEPLDPGAAKQLRGLLAELVAGLVPGGVGPDPELAARAGYLITRVHQYLRVEAERLLVPLGLHPRHVGLLGALSAAAPCSQQEIARRLGISAPVVLERLEPLLAEGLVGRQRNPADRRAYDLELLPAGREALSNALLALGQNQTRVNVTLSPERALELNQLLARLVGLPPGGRPGRLS